MDVKKFEAENLFIHKNHEVHSNLLNNAQSCPYCFYVNIFISYLILC